MLDLRSVTIIKLIREPKSYQVECIHSEQKMSKEREI